MAPHVGQTSRQWISLTSVPQTTQPSLGLAPSFGAGFFFLLRAVAPLFRFFLVATVSHFNMLGEEVHAQIIDGELANIIEIRLAARPELRDLLAVFLDARVGGLLHR